MRRWIKFQLPWRCCSKKSQFTELWGGMWNRSHLRAQ